MNKLAQWIYAYKVCSKYNLKLRYSFCKGFGQYIWDDKIVSVDFFSNNFMSIFLHEVGHHVQHQKVNYSVYLKARPGRPNISGTCVYKNLESEAFASRFAGKTGKCDRVFLLKCFNTYTASMLRKPYKLCEFGIFERMIDTIEQCSRKISR